MASFEAEWATFTHYCAAIGAHQKASKDWVPRDIKQAVTRL